MGDKFPGRRSGHVRYGDFVDAMLGRGVRSSRDRDDRRRYDDDEDDAIRKLRREIQRLAENKRGAPDYRRVFREFDRDGNGRIDRSEFRRAMNDLGIELSSSELTQVIKKFDKDGDGQISIREFIRFTESRDGDTGGDRRSDHIADMVRDEIKRLSRSGGRRLDLHRAFEEFDRNDSGKINEREFKDELRRLGFDFNRDDLQKLMDRLDVDGDRKISYREFRRFAEGDRESSRDDADDAFEKIRRLVRRAEDDGISMRECFEHFDTDRSGDIEEDELQRGLRKLKIDLTRHETKMVMDKFPGRRSGHVRYGDFVDAMLGRGVRSSRDRDRDRDDPRRYDDDEDDAIRKLRREIQRLAENKRSAPDYRRVFREFDRDGNGRIDRSEFRQAMNDLGIDLS